MSENVQIERARIHSHGMVAIPGEILAALGLSAGDQVVFVVEDGAVRIMDPADIAMRRLQERMRGQAAKAGFAREEDVDEWITRSRREEDRG